MWMLYLIAGIVAAVGAWLCVKSEKINWKEWLGGVVMSFIVVGLCHWIAIAYLARDTETWSGWITKTTHHPFWHAEWTEVYTTSDGKGNTTVHTRHCERDYPEHWTASDTLQETYEISLALHKDFKRRLGGKLNVEQPHKSNFHSGDENTYVTRKAVHELIPTNTWKTFENRVKATPNVFTYQKVPEGANVYEYPKNEDPFVSDRVVGPVPISRLKWDQLNARLGAACKINLIIVGFKENDSSLGQLQEAHWFGGRKNDFVICYGGPASKPAWVHVFSWSDEEMSKVLARNLILEEGVSNDIIPKLSKIIVKEYRLKDWSKFDYIEVRPSTKAMIICYSIVILLVSAYWAWAWYNGIDDEVEHWYDNRY